MKFDGFTATDAEIKVLDEIYNGPNALLLQRFLDHKVTSGIKTHDIKIKREIYPTRNQMELYKIAIKECAKRKIDIEVVDILQLRFSSVEDIDKKLKYILPENWSKRK